mmetsp:Transcript_20015/g.48453  ORF Transcript_20015/g.48453 Transcript_20015/m.48453 type:complete len:331 (+) Transcript_20015:780-1772(+)
MCFWPSFIRFTYRASDTVSPSLVWVDSKRSSFASFLRFLVSSMIPSLMVLPKASLNSLKRLIAPSPSSSSSSSSSSPSSFFSSLPSASAFSASSSSLLSSSSASMARSSASDIFFIMSSAFDTSFFLITLRTRDCWSISRETLRGRSSESTTPRMNDRYRGMRSSNSSEMKTRRTYSRRFVCFVCSLSKRSEGAFFGMNRIDRNWISPSAVKWILSRGASKSLDSDLKKLAYSSSVTSDGARTQIALVSLISSQLLEVFFTFLVLGLSSSLSSSSSTSDTSTSSSSFFSASPSPFAAFSAAAFASASSSGTSISSVLVSWRKMGKLMNSE